MCAQPLDEAVFTVETQLSELYIVLENRDVGEPSQRLTEPQFDVV